MFQTRGIYSFCLLWFLSVHLPGCAQKPSFENQSAAKVFNSPFDDVWKACQKSLIQYPIRVNNSETGALETDYVKGARAFKAPDQKEPFSSGYRYRLILRVVRGNLKGRDATKVKVHKEVEVQRDFFSNPEILSSDGLEERVLVYRIERELTLDKSLTKAAD